MHDGFFHFMFFLHQTLSIAVYVNMELQMHHICVVPFHLLPYMVLQWWRPVSPSILLAYTCLLFKGVIVLADLA